MNGICLNFPETPLWLLLQVAPIRNERDLVVLFLLTFRDITALKQPIDSEDTKGGEPYNSLTCLSKIKYKKNSEKISSDKIGLEYYSIRGNDRTLG